MQDPPDHDEDREAILFRRRRFVALAMSGLTSAASVGCGSDESAPAAPIEAPLVDDPGAPQVCLSIEAEPMPGDAGDAEDAAPDAAPGTLADTGPPDTGVEDPKPPRMVRRRRRRPPPGPQPCLQPGYDEPLPCLSLDGI